MYVHMYLGVNQLFIIFFGGQITLVCSVVKIAAQELKIYVSDYCVDTSWI
jgi:hypothetical protein